jgi:2-polyprenyl-3-methyl-5-hydroxy-6-metoxy-1,4-benzoquinol methylase
MLKTPNLRCHVCHQGDLLTSWGESKDFEYYSSSDTFTFFECLRCKSIFIDPTPKENLALIYPSNYYSFVPGKKSLASRLKDYFDKRFFLRLLSRIPASSISVLDVGGGTGWLLDIIRAADPRVKFTQVVDIDASAGATARKSGHEYFQGTVEDFSSPRKFDLILLLNLIEHVDDPRAVLISLRRILTDDGMIIIKTPNYDSLDARIFRASYWGGLHCPRHWHLFTKESFEALATSADLKFALFRYTQGAPFWAVSFMTMLAKRGLIKTSANRPLVYHPLYTPLLTASAVFDVLRGALQKTSQMFIVLKK